MDLVSEGISFLHGHGLPKDRNYGYLTSVEAETAQVEIAVMIGVCSHEKAQKFDLSLEKARRLSSNPGHISSFESRDPGADKWGGSIRAKSRILSFSGLPNEKFDEAAMVYVAMKLGWIENFEALQIAAASDNEYVRIVMRALAEEQHAVIAC